jgi:hypothetical protein
MDKNIGHFNPQILEQFRNMVYRNVKPVEEIKLDKKQIISLIDEYVKKGLTRSEINEAYQYTKEEIGSAIDSWHGYRAFERNLEKFLEYLQTPCEEKTIGKREVDYLVGLIKPLHYRDQVKLPQETKLGYIKPEALEKYQEDASQPGSRKACRKDNGDIYRIPLNRECRGGQEIPDPGPVSKKGDKKEPRKKKGRKPGRSRKSSSQNRSSIIQSLKGKLGAGAGGLDVKPIGNGK